MFAILDTDHLRELVSRSSPLGARLRERILERQAEVFACIIVVEESQQGWMALLNRLKQGLEQVPVYERMQATLEAAVKLGVLPFDQDAAEIFVALRQEFRRAGTMDLKIASIAITHEALLLSRNIEDFKDIPGLEVENWLDEASA